MTCSRPLSTGWGVLQNFLLSSMMNFWRSRPLSTGWGVLHDGKVYFDGIASKFSSPIYGVGCSTLPFLEGDWGDLMFSSPIYGVGCSTKGLEKRLKSLLGSRPLSTGWGVLLKMGT